LHIPVVDLGQGIEVRAGVVGLVVLPCGDGQLQISIDSSRGALV
jgi:hypothetical protein